MYSLGVNTSGGGGKIFRSRFKFGDTDDTSCHSIVQRLALPRFHFDLHTPNYSPPHLTWDHQHDERFAENASPQASLG